MAILSVLLTIALSLGLSAASIGISNAMTDEETRKAAENQATPAQVADIIAKITDRARKLGSQKLTEVSQKLQRLENAYPAIMGSSAVRGVMNKLVNAQRDVASNYEKTINAMNQDMDSINSRANAYSYYSDRYKNSEGGKQQLEEIKKEAQDVAKKYEQKLKEVSN